MELDYAKLCQEILKQEKLLQFDQFTNEMAFEIGLMLKNKAEKDGKCIVVNIQRYGQTLFHFAHEDTCMDNEVFIAAKNRIVNRFFHSSLYFVYRLRESGKTPEEAFRVDSMEFIPCGGGFPVMIKNVGVVGTITVSNMAEEDDHRYIVEVLQEYLKV
ncbi:heme-degrading domain-containing protein [Paenibacillus sp. FSL W8-1187]|uniref:heme-degrading domain-containing protein n=1 Tax=Paenibacillus sp. FSL W8-1187 TaxID=2975339 RepID=UPI0030D77539